MTHMLTHARFTTFYLLFSIWLLATPAGFAAPSHQPHANDAGAHGAAIGSPEVASGNVIQVPVHVPVNVCGNTINVIGLLNPAFGNTCVNK